MGKFSVNDRNVEGQMVVVFPKGKEVAAMNTYFKTRKEHRSG